MSQGRHDPVPLIYSFGPRRVYGWHFLGRNQCLVGPLQGLLLPDPVDRLVPGDPQEEPLQASPGRVESPRAPPQGHERVLGDLLGDRGVGHDPARHAQHDRTQHLHDLGESGVVPLHQPGEKGPVLTSIHEPGCYVGGPGAGVTLAAVAQAGVERLYQRRRPPFIVASSILVIVSLAMARLPESLVAQLGRNAPLNGSASGWAYRLLAFIAVAQVAYGGFAVFRIDRVEKARAGDPKVAAMPHEDVIGSLSRNAAGMVLLTLLYGLASFWVTGQRGGFWLFPLLCVAQGAWYLREAGIIARWMTFQPPAGCDEVPEAVWQREPPGYSPPIARAMRPLERPEEPAPTGSE